MPRRFKLWKRVWAHARRRGAVWACGLGWRCSAPVSTVGTPTADATPPVDDWRGGCGWFDSSHDLAAGLSVQALDAEEAAPGSVPLALWLAWATAAPTTAGEVSAAAGRAAALPG